MSTFQLIVLVILPTTVGFLFTHATLIACLFWLMQAAGFCLPAQQKVANKILLVSIVEFKQLTGKIFSSGVGGDQKQSQKRVHIGPAFTKWQLLINDSVSYQASI